MRRLIGSPMALSALDDFSAVGNRLPAYRGHTDAGVAGAGYADVDLVDIAVVLRLDGYFPAAFFGGVDFVVEPGGGELNTALAGIDGRRVGPTIVRQVGHDAVPGNAQVISIAEVLGSTAHRDGGLGNESVVPGVDQCSGRGCLLRAGAKGQPAR